MKISVIMSVYNEEKYIAKAIESVLGQTLTDLELIIVNDGSTDNTLNVINSFDDSRIRVISHDNIGPGASRNRAMKIAKGEYIAFIDGDDWFSPDALEKSFSQAKLYDTDITMYQMINYDDETGRVYENDWFDLLSFDESFDSRAFHPSECHDFLFDLSVGVCQKIYRNSFLQQSGVLFPEGIFFEDMPFFFEIFLKAERISIIRKHFYYRRKHKKSITNVVDCKFLDTVPAGRELMKRFVENGFYEDYKYDMIAYKINGPRLALSDIVDECKKDLFCLIHDDYLEIRDSIYYDDFLNELGPVKRKFFLDVIEASSYDEYLLNLTTN